MRKNQTTHEVCQLADGMAGACSCGNTPKAILDAIRAGDRVTIETRFNQHRTGRAVLRGPHGWVLNMGGAYGTPGIADESNIVRVKRVSK